jgi:hypothetical protein
LAKIYDPLGLVSPTTLIGKLLYRDVCDLKPAWDAPVPRQPNIRWKKWFDGLPNDVQFPRSIVRHQETIESVDLHSFGDASGNGVAAAVYYLQFLKSILQESIYQYTYTHIHTYTHIYTYTYILIHTNKAN